MNIKKLISVSLTGILAGILSFPASAEEVAIDGIIYNILDDNSAQVSDYVPEAELGDVVIPDSIDYAGAKYEVVSIGYVAFAYCTSLTSIELPESVTSIDLAAFAYCTSLTAIDLPESLTSIGDYAFRNCTSLTKIEIPELVSTIGYMVFYYCRSLKMVDLPESLTSIGDFAFSFCSSLTEIDLPESLTSIGVEAFSHCSSLTEIDIPESVTSIGGHAFYNCSSLITINVAENNPVYSSLDGVLYNKELTELITCPGAKSSINIPVTVTSIGGDAFSFCSSLTEIELPETVTSIGRDAFSHCSSLTEMDIPESVTSIGNYAFSYCSSLITINVAENNPVYSSIDGVLYNKELTELITCPGAKSSINIPATVTSIGDGAFLECTSLTEIELPESLISIGEVAFAHCTSLTEIELPESVTSIGGLAFVICPLLNKVICKAVEVPEIVFNTFDGISQDAILYVPAQALEDYENADWDQYFSQILPLEEAPDAGVSGIAADNDGYYRIYNLKGMAVKTTKDASELNSLPAGLYIINGKKVMLLPN